MYQVTKLYRSNKEKYAKQNEKLSVENRMQDINKHKQLGNRSLKGFIHFKDLLKATNKDFCGTTIVKSSSLFKIFYSGNIRRDISSYFFLWHLVRHFYSENLGCSCENDNINR
jgi:hypothetical protein